MPTFCVTYHADVYQSFMIEAEDGEQAKEFGDERMRKSGLWVHISDGDLDTSDREWCDTLRMVAECAWMEDM